MKPEMHDLIDHALYENEPLIIASFKNADRARALSHKRVLFITSDCPDTEIFYNTRHGEIRWVNLHTGSIWEAQRDELSVPMHTSKLIRHRSKITWVCS